MMTSRLIFLRFARFTLILLITESGLSVQLSLKILGGTSLRLIKREYYCLTKKKKERYEKQAQHPAGFKPMTLYITGFARPLWLCYQLELQQLMVNARNSFEFQYFEGHLTP